MHFFISYKFTGEPYEELVHNIGIIENSLKNNGHSVYSSLEDEEWFQKNKPTNKEILDHTIQKMDESDVVLVFLNSSEKSEGVLIEIGYAIARNKKIILLIKKGVEANYLKDIANAVIEFSSIQELEDLNVSAEI
ncbi:nucleoside 2-deoxyribosyltransferase [Candidatus Nomurabacteria bacterium]|nr:nucleoside 2-deoxyribosyltransferase [Candidatus Nomurabacteria bacterium]